MSAAMRRAIGAIVMDGNEREGKAGSFYSGWRVKRRYLLNEIEMKAQKKAGFGVLLVVFC